MKSDMIRSARSVSRLTAEQTFRTRRFAKALIRLSEILDAHLPVAERQQITRLRMLRVADKLIDLQQTELAKAPERKRRKIARNIEEAIELRWIFDAYPNEPRLN